MNPYQLLYHISDGIRNPNYKRKQLFIYPDYMEGWFSGSTIQIFFTIIIDKNNLYEELYTTPEDLGLIHYWIDKRLAGRSKQFL